ncbi:hypothetical protein KEJ37_02785 [Candidatus Bathyarchaeota archaeon]|nr:hypothetical protein [Candidatus Bathyarchaeota archaeon]
MRLSVQCQTPITNTERIDVELAKRQHIEYCKTLRNLGLKVIWATGDDTLPDSCFVEDKPLFS